MSYTYLGLNIGNDIYLSTCRTCIYMGQNLEQAVVHNGALHHYIGVTMTTVASQITSLTAVYSIVYWGADERKHQKLRVAGLCTGNSPGPVNSPHKGPVTRKMVPFHDFIMTKLAIWSFSAFDRYSFVRVIPICLALILFQDIALSLLEFPWRRNTNFIYVYTSNRFIVFPCADQLEYGRFRKPNFSMKSHSGQLSLVYQTSSMSVSPIYDTLFLCVA